MRPSCSKWLGVALAGVGLLWGSSALAATSTVVNENSKLCMDLKNKSAAVGTPIQQWACNGGKNQEWIFVSVGGGAYNIESELTGKCVGIQGGKATSHAQLEEEDCDGGENQKFTLQAIAPGSVQDYAQWVHLVAAMLRGGFTPDEAAKIAGGNYMRIFRAAVG